MKAKKLRVVDDALQHFLSIFVLLPADRVAIVAGSRNLREQWLPARPRAGLQYVPQISIWLRMQLVEDHAMHIQPVLREGVRAEHAIHAVRLRDVDRALVDLRELAQRRRALDHALGFVKYDRGLVAVRRCTVDFGARLVIGEQQQVRDAGR